MIALFLRKAFWIPIVTFILIGTFFYGLTSHFPEYPDFKLLSALILGLVVALLLRWLLLSQEALQESELKFRTLTESTSAAIFVSNEQRGLTYANRAAFDLLGYDAEQMSSFTNESIIHPESRQKVEQVIESYLNGQPLPDKIELKSLPIDGRTLWTESTVATTVINGERYWISTHFDITDRKKAEQALKESEERYRTIFENAQFGIFRVDEQGKFLIANRAMAKIHGYEDPEQFIAEYNQAARWVDQRERERLQKEFDAGGGKVDDFEAQFYRKDDSIVWTRTSARLYPENGFVDGVSINITQEKQIIRALIDSEERFRTLAESTTASILITSEHQGLLYANRAAMELLGYNQSELSKLAYYNLIHPTSIAELTPTIEQYVQSDRRTPLRFEACWLDSQNREHWMESTLAIIELGKEHVWVVTSFDISERKRAIEAVKASENTYRTIFETTGSAMVILDEHFYVQLANSEFTSLTGYTLQEIQGSREWMQIFSEETLERIVSLTEQYENKEGTAPPHFEVRLTDRYGITHEGIVTVGLIPETRLKVAAFLDLTERKQAEDQMYRADKMAALGQIIAGVAHEINNPNNFIYFNLPILKRYIEAIEPLLEVQAEQNEQLRIMNMSFEDFIEDVYKLLENMQHGSSRITGIVAELKNYIRNQEAEDKAPGDLKKVIGQVMTLVGKQVHKMVRRLDVTLPEHLPEVVMNAGKIEQVLINLLINAGQAADKEDSWVTLSAKEEHERVVITIADNGQGMDEQVKSHIFDPFFTTKGREAGTGLGLAISQRIIHDHEGSIKVDSEVGKGTTFTITLPV